MVNLSKINKSIFKESFWIITGQIFSIIGSLLIIKILTNVLSVEDFGELSLAFSIAAFIVQIVMGGLINGFSRFFSIAFSKNDLFQFSIAVKKLLGRGSLVLFLIFLFILIFRLNLFRNNNDIILLLLFIYSLLSSYVSSFSGILGAARQRMSVTIYSTLELFFKIVFLLIFSIFGRSNLITILISNIIAQLLIIILQISSINSLIFNSIKQISNIATNWSNEIWKFSYPFSVWGIFTSLQVSSDKWALNKFSNLNSLGAYSIIYQFGWAPIALITNLLMTLVSPILYNRAGNLESQEKIESSYNLLMKLTIISLACTFVAFFIAFLIHDSIFKIFVSKDFRFFSYLLPYVILASGFYSTGQLLSIKLLTELNSNRLKTIKISTAILGILFNIFGAYFYGIYGVLIGLNLFSLIYFILIFKCSFQINTSK